jgi:hypothetical protein
MQLHRRIATWPEQRDSTERGLVGHNRAQPLREFTLE